MPKIRSFDVFDTLFARRYINNDSLLHTMEKRYDIPNFYNARKAADTGTRSLQEIYQALCDQGVISHDKLDLLLKAEIALERETIFPIKENIEKVRDGDLLISDMYMSGPDILSLTRSVGMDKQVTIYQSNSGKASGRIWQELQGLDLEYHIGDNLNSDYNRPVSAGFPAVHYTHSTVHTDIEQYFHSNGLQHLALMIREIRIKSHTPGYEEFLELANQGNLSFLFFTCEMLHRKYPGKKLAFLGRDCQLMYKLYNHYYEPAYYVPFSRIVALQQPVAAADYLLSQIPKDCILVDISSTGKTWEKMCEFHPFNIEVLLYVKTFKYSKERPVLPETFSYITTTDDVISNQIIEVFNCGDHGHLKSITTISGIPVAEYGEPELKKEIVDVIHIPVNEAICLSKFYNVRGNLSELSDSDLFNVFSAVLKYICSSTKINDSVGDYYKLENEYLKEVKSAANS